MRLLLDEYYQPALAARLRAGGHDVVHARGLGLEGASDEAILEAALAEERGVLTNNVRHFVPIARRWEAEGREHAGLIFSSDRSLPRSAGGIGALAEAVDALIRERGDERLHGLTLWLRPS